MYDIWYRELVAYDDETDVYAYDFTKIPVAETLGLLSAMQKTKEYSKTRPEEVIYCRNKNSEYVAFCYLNGELLTSMTSEFITFCAELSNALSNKEIKKLEEKIK